MAQSKIEKLANYSVILIALVALIVSVWQVKLFQNHNKLTVKPYLDSHSVQEDSTLNISFSNKGLGPAIIQSITFESGNKKYTTTNDLLMGIGEMENAIRRFNYSKNSVLSSGEKNLLVQLKNTDYRDVNVIIVYESIYGDEEILKFSF